jgi:hypothetical protein
MPTGVYKRTDEHRSKLSLARKGKTYEELYGAERAEELKHRCSLIARDNHRKAMKPNESVVEDSMVRIKLTQGKWAIIDRGNYDRIKRYRWCALYRDCTWYAQAWISGESILMHRLLLDTKKGEYTDHRDHDGLNNVLSNIRKCTQTQNIANQLTRKDPNKTSRYKGVSFDGRIVKCWRARITVNGKKIHLGRCYDEKDAALVYDQAALEYFGEFSKLNFPINVATLCERT